MADRWPEDLRPLFQSAITAEYASLTRAGTPVTVPTTPYVGTASLDVSTGLTYPTKAERARRNGRVCLLFADAEGTGLPRPPVVAVQGFAAVRDADLQANADRYVRDSITKLPEATKGQPRFILRRMAWYYARIWIEITPTTIWSWPDRDLSVAPTMWKAPGDLVLPTSDPTPSGVQPGVVGAPDGWTDSAQLALHQLHHCDLTVVDAEGWPLCLPVAAAEAHPDGFKLSLGSGAPEMAAGPACVTFHDHPVPFTGQQNRTFMGRIVPSEGGVVVVVDRVLADWSLAGGKAKVALGFLNKGRLLRPRLKAEAARRGQAVPKVRFPNKRAKDPR